MVSSPILGVLRFISYLFERGKDLPSTGSLPKWPRRPGLARLKLAAMRLLWVPCVSWGPKHLVIFGCFPRCSWEMEPYGMWGPQGPTYQPGHSAGPYAVITFGLQGAVLPQDREAL